ncbi:hypothetical protein U2F26_02570 [Micromonospora sp. 4G57]|uniref:Uncharacterized protein n=2 Tax=Micromonospora TaxID=1873 RepID=A0ABU5JBP1_9ACTN|nr:MULTISPECIES: hypothetical protein [unclassified Micromonospora]MDZ5441618.1 hypothetical protein [Micromonospora sp. 4G57]MDZ5490015.1 hypothetical protein [Micromonospora sp. 4G53]
MPGDHWLRPVVRSYSAQPRLPSSSAFSIRRWSSSSRCQQTSRPPRTRRTLTSKSDSAMTPARFSSYRKSGSWPGCPVTITCWYSCHRGPPTMLGYSSLSRAPTRLTPRP